MNTPPVHKYGIRVHKLSWIQAFLWSMSQHVVIDEKESVYLPVTFGVSQGSVLQPILFLLSI